MHCINTVGICNENVFTCINLSYYMYIRELFCDIELREEVEKKFEKWLEPPPVKQPKPLPRPDDPIKKRRGGRRYVCLHVHVIVYYHTFLFGIFSYLNILIMHYF